MREDIIKICEAYNSIVNRDNVYAVDGDIFSLPNGKNDLKNLKESIGNLTPAQEKSLNNMIKDGYEFVTKITDSSKHKGSILVRDYENITFANSYNKDLGANDRCAIIDTSGKVTQLTLKQFSELEG